MKKLLVCILSVLLLLTGCSTHIQENNYEIKQNVPAYSRTTTFISLKENFNPYIMDFSSEGVFYYVPDSSGDEVSDEHEHADINRFYYSEFADPEKSFFICEQAGSYVRDLDTVKKNDGIHFVILSIGESADILDYDSSCNLVNSIKLPAEFNTIKNFPVLLALRDGNYAVGFDDTVILILSDGTVKKTLKINGYIRDILENDEGIFVVFEETKSKKTTVKIAEADISNGRFRKDRIVPADLGIVYPFDKDHFASFSTDKIYVFDMDESGDEIRIDLNAQSIMSSQIQNVSAEDEDVQIVLFDDTEPESGISRILLSKNSVEANTDSSSEKDIYSEDGRRIIQIAVPENYEINIEFHIKKYNQKSDKWFAKAVRFNESIEEYLGKGNRPDVILLNDLTDIRPLIDKGVLENMIPLFEGQDSYSIDDILPKARELLSVEGEMFAMSGCFTLLIRASDKSEYNDAGFCTAEEYLRWYNSFLNKNNIIGMGEMDSILYADISSYYNEAAASSYFESDEFKSLMAAYKNLLDDHKGDLDKSSAKDTNWLERQILLGPSWKKSWRQMQFTVENSFTTGIPVSAGTDLVLMNVLYPMGILAGSPCREGAFDFIMYYSSLEEYLGKGMSEGDYGHSAVTQALFSTNNVILNKEIFETELPYQFTRDDAGVITEYYYTEDQKETLRKLIDNAVGDTRTRRDLFQMLEEELDGYFYGNKELDDCCHVLQSRAQIYLSENNN